MPNRETVRALLSAFNVHNYARNTVKTNFKLQSRGKKDYIVVSFDKSMDTYQCSRYLGNIQRKIIREFYGIEESNDAEISDTAELIFDVTSFPFDWSGGDWYGDEQHGFKFAIPIDQGVIFNLKSHLAASLAKDVIEGMPTCNIRASDRKGYLWHGEFDNKRLRQQFESKFLTRMRERYENVPKKPLKVKDNSVYIKDVFDNARFIDSVTRYKAWLVGMYLGVDSSANHKVKLFKDMIIESIGQSTGVTIYGFVCASPLGKEEASILIPLVLDGEEKRILTNEEALELNCTFNCAVFYDLYGRTQGKLSINESSGMYSINFSNPYISHCVITKIIKNSVINKDHELAIDPELRFQALSRSPSTELSDMELESPTRSQGVASKDSPRQGSEREKETEPFWGVLGEEIGQASTSSQQTDMPSSSYTYIDKRDESMPEDSYFLPSTLTSFPRVITPPVHYTISTKPILLTTKNDQKSSSLEFSARSPCLKDVNILGMKSEEHDKSEQGACSQVGVRALEGDQADDESMLIKIQGQQVSYRSSGPYIRGGKRMQSVLQRLQLSSSKSSSFRPSSIPCLTAWDSSTFLNSEVSEDSPKDTANICNEEPEKQQVTDESDRKSSDECSEAKSQDSKSPKKHGGGVQKIKKFFSSHFKKQHDVNLKRHDEGRDSVCSISSSLSAPGGSVPEKLPVSESSSSFPGRIKAKSNPPSGVTSPTHEGAPGGLKPLTSDERKELRPLLSPKQQRKLDSNSFLPGEEQHLYLTHTLSGKRELSRSLCESKESQLRRLAEAQLSSPDNSSSKRDSGYSSGLPASPAAQHKGSVSSELKHPQQVKHTSEALGKEI